MFSAVDVSNADVVTVNMNVQHSVNGVSEFDRSRFILVHAGLHENDWDSDQMRHDFLTDYDVYLGRNNGALQWHLSQTTEDPSRSGFIDHSVLESRGDDSKANHAADTASHLLEHRIANHMIGGQMNMYPNGQINANNFGLGSYEAYADYFERFLTYFYGSGGATGEPKPAMVEVVNEPFVKASQYQTTKANIAELHNVVANKVKETHPDVMVGGYTAAHPQFEDNNFGLWDANWKMFIDVAGENMDFYSIHLYDYLAPESHHNPANTQYRSGSNIEAILDLIEHYSMLALGEVKPFAISEYGSFEPITGGEPWSPETNWSDLRSFSSILMQLLERPDRVLQAMPFVVVKAEWGRNQSTGYPYGPRLLRQRFEDPSDSGNDWVFTELIKHYQLWQNVKGTRVDTTATDQDLQVDAYVDGKHLYLILNNLELEAKTVDLKFIEREKFPIVSAYTKHSYAIDQIPRLEETHYNGAPSQVDVAANATMIIEYEFEHGLTIDQQSGESKYYATTYLKPITSNQEIPFQINSVNVPEHGEAILRLGVGRDHGKTLNPQVNINGSAVEVPDDWRGYDQNTRSKFFGVLEIPVPIELIQTNNEVAIEFSDSGGHVSSVSMQIWEFSSSIRETNIEPIEGFSYQYDQINKRITLRAFGETSKAYTVEESDDMTNCTDASETRIGKWDWLEFDVSGDSKKFLRIRSKDTYSEQ